MVLVIKSPAILCGRPAMIRALWMKICEQYGLFPDL
jgi:hypothetical protein